MADCFRICTHERVSQASECRSSHVLLAAGKARITQQSRVRGGWDLTRRERDSNQLGEERQPLDIGRKLFRELCQRV
ncbi:hypothetical protein D3C83_84950 [compost metagenome]